MTKTTYSPAEMRYRQKVDLRMEELFKPTEKINLEVVKKDPKVEGYTAELRKELTLEFFDAIDRKDPNALQLIIKSPSILSTIVERQITWKNKIVTAKMTALMYVLYDKTKEENQNENAAEITRALLYPNFPNRELSKTQLQKIRELQIRSFCSDSGFSSMDFAHYVKDKIAVYEIFLSSLSSKKDRTLVCRSTMLGGVFYDDENGILQSSGLNFFYKAVLLCHNGTEVKQIVTLLTKLGVDLKNPIPQDKQKPIIYFGEIFTKYLHLPAAVMAWSGMNALVEIAKVYPDLKAIKNFDDLAQTMLLESYRDARTHNHFGFCR